MAMGIAVAVVVAVSVLARTLNDDYYAPSVECIDDLPGCAQPEES